MTRIKLLTSAAIAAVVTIGLTGVAFGLADTASDQNRQQTSKETAVVVAKEKDYAAYGTPKSLFALDQPVLKWNEFSAAGYDVPVSGVIYTATQAPCCGVPAGGLDAGHIDIDARGIFGWSTIFNPESVFPYKKNWMMPRKLPVANPILGLSVGGQTWVLASKQYTDGSESDWCTEPYLDGRWADPGTYKIDKLKSLKLEDIKPADDIRYWGHYPVADLEYVTDAPVSVGMRVWSPFLPGDAVKSDTPAIVFEVHLRNTTMRIQNGTVAINFPGPLDAQEARGTEFTRTPASEDFKGVLVKCVGGNEYALGVIGSEQIRTGAGLNKIPSAWSKIATELPVVSPGDGSASCAVDFHLAPGASQTVRYLLAWYAPQWKGATKTMGVGIGQKFEGGWLADKNAGDTNFYTHMYATRYTDVLDVTRAMVRDHEKMLSRIIGWQQVVYGDKKLPVWLRDSLVNNLALIAEDGMWAQGKYPLPEWSVTTGIFALNECPRGCPNLECIPCDWYGNLPIAYFFPELARSTLRIFKDYQRPNGETAFWLGHMGDLPDLLTPAYYWQQSLNGTCYITMVDRLWQATGDDSILNEFYDSVKKANTFTMNLNTDPGGVISFPKDGGMEWFEHGDWAGMAPHMGGLHLAQLRVVQRMAEKIGDKEYVRQCRAWFAEGSKAMENKMWNGTYYLNFWDPTSGKRSDDIMGYQLDGQWMAIFHGLDGVFRKDRVKTTLQTIKKCNIALTPDIGAANFTRPDGSPLETPKDAQGKEETSYYGTHAMFSAELICLAATYMDAGEKDYGLNLARKFWENLVIKQRHPWDMPNMVDGKTGKRLFGTDYYQCMMLWALPTSIYGTDIEGTCAPDGLVRRVVNAAAGGLE